MATTQATRLIIVIWGTLEILLFGGLIFGWASLVYVFKLEGYFSHVCLNEDGLDKALGINFTGTASDPVLNIGNNELQSFDYNVSSPRVTSAQGLQNGVSKFTVRKSEVF